MNRRRALTVLQVFVSIACLLWLWRQPEIHSGLLRAVARAEPSWIFCGILLAGLVIGLGIVRWQFFLRLQGIRLTWGENAKLSFIGAFFNLILIGTVGGDAVKILYLMRRFPQRRSQAVVSILMDHLCGLPAVVTMYGVFCLARWEWLSTAEGLSSQLALFAGIYLAVSVVGILLLFITAAFGLTERTPRRLPLRQHAIKFSQALSLFLKHWPVTLAGVGLSFLIHWLYFATFHTASLAMNAHVAWLDIFTIMPVVDVITTVPVSISGIGIRETLFESFLHQLCQVPREIGVMISLLGFGFSVFWSLAGGLLFPFYRPASPDGHAETLRSVIHQARDLPPEEDTRSKNGDETTDGVAISPKLPERFRS